MANPSYTLPKGYQTLFQVGLKRLGNEENCENLRSVSEGVRMSAEHEENIRKREAERRAAAPNPVGGREPRKKNPLPSPPQPPKSSAAASALKRAAEGENETEKEEEPPTKRKCKIDEDDVDANIFYHMRAQQLGRRHPGSIEHTISQVPLEGSFVSIDDICDEDGELKCTAPYTIKA